jgi:hypothetical protein
LEGNRLLHYGELTAGLYYITLHSVSPPE